MIKAKKKVAAKKTSPKKIRESFDRAFSAIDEDHSKEKNKERLPGVPNCNHVVQNRWYGLFKSILGDVQTACRGKGTTLGLQRWVPWLDPADQVWKWKIVKGARIIWVSKSNFFICDKTGCAIIGGLPKVIRGILEGRIGERIVIDTAKVGGDITIDRWFFVDALPLPIPDPPATN